MSETNDPDVGVVRVEDGHWGLGDDRGGGSESDSEVLGEHCCFWY